MEELREIARAHYRAGSPEVQHLAYEFFKSLDTNGDGRVQMNEFLAFMRQEGHMRMYNTCFFNELDRDQNGTLEFNEVMTLYYIIKSGRPFCDWCGQFIPGIFFSCVECHDNPGGSFVLCKKCYSSKECNHNHNRRVQFLDNYTLLESKRVSATAHAHALSQYEASNLGTPHQPSSSIVPVPTANLYMSPSGVPTHTYVANPSPSNAIVPASNANKWRLALKALELGLSIGSISTTLCTIL